MKTILLLLLFMTTLFSLDIERPKVYNDQNIKSWLMSEKLDGIRAYWNGKKLLTKNGNIINYPKNFTNNFPKFPLDGELWTKRNDFENIQSIVLDKTPSKKWEEITYNVFEAPYSKGDFKQRLEKVKIWFSKNPNKNVRLIKQIECKDKKHLDSFLEEIINKKGEGVIVKNPNLPYINKRSSNSLKVKKFFDMEGVVIAHNKNINNKFKSLKIRLKNKVVFNLGNGFTKEEKLNPPKIGEIVTFKYYGFTKYKKPKFASFLRVRKAE